MLWCSGITGTAYKFGLPEERVIVDKIGSMFLGEPALAKAATREANSVGAFLYLVEKMKNKLFVLKSWYSEHK